MRQQSCYKGTAQN